MNILFILGNGFDLNLGMETSYTNFYETYKLQPSDNDLIKNLKLAIGSGIESWADLELAFGRYTNELKNRDEFFIVFNDIRKKLVDYIAQQDNLFVFDPLITSQFLEDMRTPYKYLTEAEKDIFKTIYDFTYVNINAITFNYTRSLEKIIGYNDKPVRIESAKLSFSGIEHIHGFTDKRFVLGVDNVEQIANESFRNDERIVTTLVKPKLNTKAQHLTDRRCMKLIDEAAIICLFGTSIGETDKMWWNYIGRRLRSEKAKLIIFKKGKEISPIFSEEEIWVKESEREQFLNIASLDGQAGEAVSTRIHIAYNSNIFKMR
jgi:hypothetical protein